MTTIQVLFLGPARDFAGTDRVSLELLGGADIASLREILAKRFADLAPALNTIRFAVNDEFVNDDHGLSEGDEVALIPPVSGGTDDNILVEIVNERIDSDHVRQFILGDPELGGIVTFEGATRRDVDAVRGAIVRLDYEGHERMALRQMRRLAEVARQKFSAGRIALVHRLGPVLPGDISVMIAVACGHRDEAFKACRWLIDELKKDVPIWKKDVFDDGTTSWVDPEKPEEGR